MKDGIGESAVQRISKVLLASGANFPEELFYHDAMSALHTLELKDRVRHMIAVMARHLPESFPQTADILGKVREHWIQHDGDDALMLFAAWPLIDYVAEYGLNHPAIALPLLRYLTPLFTAEFAIRPFIETHQEETYLQLQIWCMDRNEHVRRLASEGCRPRLPWGKHLSAYVQDPTPVISLLENLKDDPSDYVRKSVANNLNDISKDHPDVVITTCHRWQIDNVSCRDWIIRHATRTLVKEGYPGVFPLLGFTSKPRLNVIGPQLSQAHLMLGDSLEIIAEIISETNAKQHVVIDYSVHYIRANGKTNTKVFKWKNLRLRPNQSVTIKKAHAFKKITTRRHYSGVHKIGILVNGRPLQDAEFMLHCP